MNVAVVNLGCKVNRVESDTIAASYLEQGHSLSDVADADMVVVNTCTVTEEADKKTRKTIRRVLRQNLQAPVLVTGCAAVIEPDFYREVDHRIVVVDKQDLLDQSAHGETLTNPQDTQPAFLRVGRNFPTRVAVKVQDGCNHSCSYCIVHVARGKAWSRPAQTISDEILQLAQHGVKEIVLSGIDLGSYSYLDESKSKRWSLTALVRELLGMLKVQGLSDVRLRISSIEPRSVRDDFVELLAQSEGRICRHLHLPLQAGSNKVLREMNRPYTADAYEALVSTLKEKVPGISLTTDIIVGFPGETEQEFQETCDLARRVGFTKIHVFRYSKRQGTPAAERTDQIESSVKEDRAHRLIQLSDELRAAYILEQHNRLERIIVEKEGWGMSESYYKVKVPTNVAPGSSLSVTLQTINSEGVVAL